MIRRSLLGVAVLVLAGCGSWQRVGTTEEPETSQALTQLMNVQEFYQRIGRLAAGGQIPWIGTMAFAAGPADSVLGILGLSLENRALTFEKEGVQFVARYRVQITLSDGKGAPIQVGKDEAVRVATFKETQRSEESVVFQQSFTLLPGTYHVAVTVRDHATGAESRAEGDYTAPAYGPATVSAPILAYQAAGRGQTTDPLQLVLNTRGTVAYGGDTLLAYIEGYSFPGPTAVPFEVRNAEDSVVWRDSLRFTGERPVESQVLRLAPDSMALGELTLAVGSGEDRRSTAAVVSFSTAWVVTNFGEMVSLLRYFGEDNRLSRMRDASPDERTELWRRFYRETDPNTATPENEALNAYFSRLAVANERFRNEGVPGWRTDRGEVFITIGEPDESFETSPGTTAGRVIRWNYIQDRLSLFFVDESGFGRYRLTPSSRADYERVLSRLRRQAD